MPYEYIDDSDLEDDDLEDDSDIPKSPMDVTSESGKATGGETPQAGNRSDHSGPAESHYCSASSSITIPTVGSGDEQGATGTDSPAKVPLGQLLRPVSFNADLSVRSCIAVAFP